MTPFTLVMAYYDNPGMLREQAKYWLRLPPDIRENLSVVLVDDCSPTTEAYHALESGTWVELKLRLPMVQLWRMGVDIRWNQDACRNIGVREAKTSWLLLTDMDHLVPERTWRCLMLERLKNRRAYRFSRVNAPNHDAYKPHPNSWAMTRGLYWKAGGYDEALAGNYGTDGDFLVRVSSVACDVQTLSWPLVRYSRDVIPDASTTTLTRKSDEDRARVNFLVKSRASSPDWRPQHFRFPCERLI